MSEDNKPRIRYVQEIEKEKMSAKMARAGRATSKHAEGFGYLLAVAIPWVAREFIPVPIPDEVLSAFSGWAVGEAVRLRERLF